MLSTFSLNRLEDQKKWQPVEANGHIGYIS